MGNDLVLIQSEYEFGNFLAHYASQYYDPEKAHEYYMQNRELKGRQSSKGMSEQQKEAWAYAKNQIGVARKTDTQAAAEAERQFLQKAREEAKAQQQAISDKLKSLIDSLINKDSGETASAMKKLAAEQKAKADEIKTKADQQISALPPIPEGVSAGTRARLMAQRQTQINKIRGDMNSQLNAVDSETASQQQKISEDAKAKRGALSSTAQADREALRIQLKATVDKARTDYTARKEALKAEYEAKTQKEYDAIKKNLPSAPAKPTKSSGGGGGKAKKANKFNI